MGRLFNTALLDEALMKELTADEASWIYNGLDCCVTAEVYNELLEELEDSPQEVHDTYDFALRKLAPIMEASLRGTLIDEAERQQTLSELQTKLDKLNTKFQRLCLGIFDTEINWRSPVQLKTLFYGSLGLKERRKRNAKGQYVATVNEEALEHFKVYLHARPFAGFILAMRELSKAIGFLKTEIDDDGRMRTSYNIAGTNTGRLSSRMSDFGTGCVRPSAEALTPTGWKPLSSLSDGDLIAQWDEGEITFVPATFYKTTAEQLIEYKTEQASLAITLEHRVLWRAYHHDEYITSAAHEITTRSQIYVPLGGHFTSGINYIPPYVAMLLADFSREGNIMRGAFKKQRKIDRLLSLADTFALDIQEQKAKQGYRRFTLRGEHEWPQKWGPWVLTITPECADALIEEASYWDAHKRGNSFLFYTADKEQAEWFQTLCHITGRSTTLRQSINSDAAYGNNSIIYIVNVKPKTEAQILRKHWRIVDYTGPVMCPQVPSSYWLVRENGFISVTGNTNVQNVDRSLRKPFVADRGKLLVNIDLEQADARNVGAILWNIFYDTKGPEYAGAYLNACESGDLHTQVCRMAWPNLEWPNDKSAWKEFCDGIILFGQDSYRQVAKKLGHGTNYYGTPRTMAQHTKSPVYIIEGFQRNYFEAFPAIPAWHEWVIEQLHQSGTLYNLFGRRRIFFGRPQDADTHRKAIAYAPQSSTGEEIDRGWYQVWSHFR